MKDNQIQNITNDVKWVGILDFDIRNFDIVMTTEYGTSYNSYFIDAEKKTIVETSKEKFKDTYIEKIKQVTDPAEIEYIVLNHTEPDHSGNLKHLLELAPNAKVVGSGNTIRYLRDMIEKPFESIQVKDGDTLDLGNKTLQFIAAPNLHWPDSTYTYLVEDKLLFTCDSFGAHFCHQGIFDDMVGNYDDAFKYYFDVILRPFSKFMLKAIDKIRPLEIDMICPGHGPVLRSDWKKYVDLSEKYALEYLASVDAEKKQVLIAYVSAYGYTKEMAEEIKKGIVSVSDARIEMIDIEMMDLGEIDSKIAISDAILIGSPTINQNILLPTYKMFAVISPLRDKGKLAGSFGSYGWSGEGVKIMDSALSSLKLKLPIEGIALKFRPDSNDNEKLFEFGKEFGNRLGKTGC